MPQLSTLRAREPWAEAPPLPGGPRPACGRLSSDVPVLGMCDCRW